MNRDSACGWLYAADRLADEGFGADDERLLLGLGAVFAAAWTSMLTLDQLDLRVAARTQALQVANAQLDAFSSLVSHDLRAPLGSIDGFARALMDRHAAALPAEAQRYLGNITRNVGVMNRLIDDLLRFAKMSGASFLPRTVDLEAVVRECLETFHEEIARRGVVVEVQALPSCRADGALLKQVMYNLIGNAVKYTLREPAAKIEIGSRTEGAEIQVFVRDNGAGFDMADASELFTPFRRMHASTEFEGSGIGLALVRQIVERHGGKVWAEAQPGRGACVTFSLPLADLT